MVSEISESHALTGSTAASTPQHLQRFFKKRQRIYAGLLVFVVVVGLPIVSVPYLRNRLSERVMAIKSAMAGNIKPVVALVGANHEPFPAEYEHPAPPIPKAPQLPPTERIFTAERSGQLPPRAAKRSVPKIAKILIPAPPAAPKEEESTGEPASAPAPAETELKYQQGKVEQEAYELLLKSNATIAGMVQGSNPSLHFKSWDAVNRGEDTYWVRLKFQSEGNPDVEYIWQVKLQTKQVTPLSYNARTIS